jgi:hypothetical protein
MAQLALDASNAAPAAAKAASAASNDEVGEEEWKEMNYLQNLTKV